MTNKRFIELATGPLAHPLADLRVLRVQMALKAVVDATEPYGSAILEDFCALLERTDIMDAEAGIFGGDK